MEAIGRIKEGNNRVYLNAPNSETDIKYESTEDTQHYFILRGYEVIASGVLKGYKNGSIYQYRFDFSNYIKIYNQDIKPFERLTDGSYKFEGNNACDLRMYIGNTDILQRNLSLNILIRDSEGTIKLNHTSYRYDEVIKDHKVFVMFVDAGIAPNDFDGYELQYRIETQPTALKGTYMPISIFRNNIFMYKLFDSNDNIIYESPQLRKGEHTEVIGVADHYILTESDNFVLNEESDAYIGMEDGMDKFEGAMVGYVTYLIRIPENAEYISFAIFDRGGYDIVQAPQYASLYPTIEEVGTHSKSVYAFKTFDGCMNPYYFWNGNGGYDTIYCSGTKNVINEVDKQYIKVNGISRPIKITTTVKYKHNTGLTLKQEQIYSLINAPQVNNITFKTRSVEQELLNIDLDTFEGYNGVKLSERNMELIFTKPKDYRRYTEKTQTFFD